MFRSFLYATVLALTAATATLSSTTAHAVTTDTYNLILTPNAGAGPISGTGSFTINTPTLGSSGFDTVGNGLLSMTFSLSNGLLFNLSNATSAGVGFNFNGTKEVINTINYTGQLMSFVLQLSTGGFTYSFNDSSNFRNNTSGTISAVLAPSPVPLPASLPLFVSGLGALALLARRRKQKQLAA